MQWTYVTYTIADYGISLGLVLITTIGVFVTFFSSKKGQEFVYERIIGVNPSKAHDDSNVKQLNSNKFSGEIKEKSLFYLSIFCCLLGGMILSITVVLMFQGCFLTSTRVLSEDNCPEYPVECFIFEKKYFSPISNHPSFVCKYSLKVELNSNRSDATAWCYGWIIRFQTTKSILDQLGISIALIGFFTTMLAIIVYLGKCKKTIVLSSIFILISLILIIVLIYFQWSFVPLTYAILCLGILLGVFGIVLYCILPDKKKMMMMSSVHRSAKVCPE